MKTDNWTPSSLFSLITLCVFLLCRYPHVVDGAFAASAPIWSFLGELPPYDAGSFAEIVTYDATQEAGATTYCAE